MIELAIKNALEPIYEGVRRSVKPPKGGKESGDGWLLRPVFLNCSHGFRPGRSAHTALEAIKG